jgi:hypothetical protein
MEPLSEDLEQVVDAAYRLARSLRDPALLISLHRDLWKMSNKGIDQPKNKISALRWGIFTMVYGATEGFFNEILNKSSSHVIPLNPDKLRYAGEKCRVRLFTREWGVRTRVKGNPSGGGNRSRWMVFEGDELRKYLRDMKELRDLLVHGGDPYSVANVSGALWVQNKGNSMNLMGVEGFFQACTDLAGQTILAFGGSLDQLPEWPQPTRTTISREKLPALKLFSDE